jgi:peptide/nickel transport system ATP-binding protein
MYPFQLSGGMARRVLLAPAVLSGARLVVADEPTPGLTEELAVEALRNLRELADGGCGVLLITHDINLALDIADTVSVFYAGQTVETASAQDFTSDDGAPVTTAARKDGPRLRHPYTKALMRALPQNGFEPLPGFQPYAGTATEKCVFYERCAQADAACAGKIPLRALRAGKVRCVHAE